MASLNFQSDLFNHDVESLSTIQLPDFPAMVRYYDDFENQFRTLYNPKANLWVIFADGGEVLLNFDQISSSYRDVIKLAFSEALTSKSTNTVISYFEVLNRMNIMIRDQIFESAIKDHPLEFVRKWNNLFLAKLTRHTGVSVRHILHWFARWEVAQWRQADADLIRQLAGHELQKYRSVLEGEAGVNPRVASIIAEHLDTLVCNAELDRIPDKVLLSGCVLALCMQHGLRRRQIALIRPDDMVVVEDSSLHIRITFAKQRNENVGRTERRRIHDAWVPLFAEWKKRCQNPFLFGRPQEIGVLVREATTAIAGVPLNASAFRHEGAQRLVDGGFSRETVSAYLGHTDVTAANHYFAAAPAQNDLVNAALGRSDVFRAVAAARRGDMITVRQLLSMPSDNQIAGVPHGIHITGIGACKSGQSLCARNPVLACYTCHKFLPLRDSAVHQDAKSKLESVVMSFAQPSSLDQVSPAMMQLRTTMNAIQNVIDMAAADE